MMMLHELPKTKAQFLNRKQEDVIDTIKVMSGFSPFNFICNGLKPCGCRHLDKMHHKSISTALLLCLWLHLGDKMIDKFILVVHRLYMVGRMACSWSLSLFVWFKQTYTLHVSFHNEKTPFQIKTALKTMEERERKPRPPIHMAKMHRNRH